MRRKTGNLNREFVFEKQSFNENEELPRETRHSIDND